MDNLVMTFEEGAKMIIIPIASFGVTVECPEDVWV
jgi:hypothetical protein